MCVRIWVRMGMVCVYIIYAHTIPIFKCGVPTYCVDYPQFICIQCVKSVKVYVDSVLDNHTSLPIVDTGLQGIDNIPCT